MNNKKCFQFLIECKRDSWHEEEMKRMTKIIETKHHQ